MTHGSYSLYTLYSHSCVCDSSSGWWRDGGWHAHACNAGTDERRDAGGLGAWCGRWYVYQRVVSCIWRSVWCLYECVTACYMKQARHEYDKNHRSLLQKSPTKETYKSDLYHGMYMKQASQVYEWVVCWWHVDAMAYIWMRHVTCTWQQGIHMAWALHNDTLQHTTTHKLRIHIRDMTRVIWPDSKAFTWHDNSIMSRMTRVISRIWMRNLCVVVCCSVLQCVTVCCSVYESCHIYEYTWLESYDSTSTTSNSAQSSTLHHYRYIIIECSWFKLRRICSFTHRDMGWLRLVGSLKLQVSFVFCKRALQKRPIFCEETCNVLEPANRSHPTCVWRSHVMHIAEFVWRIWTSHVIRHGMYMNASRYMYIPGRNGHGVCMNESCHIYECVTCVL